MNSTRPIAKCTWMGGRYPSIRIRRGTDTPPGKVEVSGTVTKVEWKSPHAWIYVDATGDKGEKVNWSFELPSPVTLMRRGWTRDSLKPGDRIKVSGAPARNFPAIAIANSIKDSNGKPLFTGITKTYEPDAGKKD